MTHVFSTLLVALLGFASIFNTVSQVCPGLFLKAKVRPNAKRGILAGKGYANIAVTLTSKNPISNLEFQLNVLNGLSVERIAMRPSPKPFTSPEIVKNADGMTVIYWLNIAFTKSKGGKRRFRVKVKADECALAMLEVNAFAYAVNGTGASCITPLAQSAIVNVRYSKAKKAATCTPTQAPTINPAQPFVLFGEGQRFSQGGRLAPFQDRRLSVPTSIKMHDSVDALRHPQDPQLQSIDTPDACYEYCSLNSEEETPFFFSWNIVTSQCFCCVGVCAPFIFDPDVNVYEINVAKTLPPTMQPTMAPTMAPTMQPTPAPTMAPTMRPTAAPTKAPTMQPTAAPTMTPTMQPTNAPTITPTSLPSSVGFPDNLVTSFVEGDFAYFGAQTTPGSVLKLNLSDFSDRSVLTFDAGEDKAISSIVSGTYAYFGTDNDPGIVVKVNLTDFTRVGKLSLEPGEKSLRGAVVKDDFAYFGTVSFPGYIAKVNLADFSRAGTLEISYGFIQPSVVWQKYAFFGSVTSIGQVSRVDLDTFTLAGFITLGFEFPVSVVRSGDFAYYGSGTDPGSVAKVNLASFAVESVITFSPGESSPISAIAHNGYVYFGTFTSPGKVLKINTSPLSLDTVETLDDGENLLRTAVVSGVHGYFGTATSPGLVVKVLL